MYYFIFFYIPQCKQTWHQKLPIWLTDYPNHFFQALQEESRKSSQHESCFLSQCYINQAEGIKLILLPLSWLNEELYNGADEHCDLFSMVPLVVSMIFSFLKNEDFIGCEEQQLLL